MALSEKARRLVELLTGKKTANKRAGNVEQFRMSRPVENVQLKEGTIAFVKSMLPSRSVPAALAQKGAVVHVSKVGGHVDLKRGFEKLAKRAPQTLITADEMQGATPVVPRVPRTEPGLSDADIQILEGDITTEALTPAEAAKRFLAAMKIIRENMGRRIAAKE